MRFPSIVPKNLWEREYTVLRSIPSSTREEPAKALLLFSEILSLRGPTKVLDVGCGNGRNSIYAAKRGCEVIAVDFCEAALNELRRRSAASCVEERITILNHFIDEPLPLPDGAFDVVLDCYTFCHFLQMDAARKFWREMARLTRPSGYMLSVVFSPEDGYYAQYLGERKEERLVLDPTNGISKRLYAEDEIKAFFSQDFQICFFSRFEFDDLVHRMPFRRVVLISVLRRA